ncbi:MAG: HEPN domain-containing protein [Nitrospirota bacterium]
MKKDYERITLEWLNKADSDLSFARASLEEFDDFYSQMCILSHDAGEKYLKAYISSHGVKPERIHDLATLLKECQRLSVNPEDFNIIEEECRILNRYYTPLKYPSHYPSATKEQAKEAIEVAMDISNFIKRQFE